VSGYAWRLTRPTRLIHASINPIFGTGSVEWDEYLQWFAFLKERDWLHPHDVPPLAAAINASTIIFMTAQLIWDETKRKANLAKHGLDFSEAGEVLDSRYRLDVMTVRGGEVRMQSFAYVFKRLRALLVVHTEREDSARIISFRPANQKESEVYYEWLSKTND